VDQLQTGVNYQVSVQTPQRLMDSLDALMRTPIAPPGEFHEQNDGIEDGNRGRHWSSDWRGSPPGIHRLWETRAPDSEHAQVLSNLARARRGVSPPITNHYNVSLC